MFYHRFRTFFFSADHQVPSASSLGSTDFGVCRIKTLHKNSLVSQFHLKCRSFLRPHSEEFLLHSHSEEICFQLYFFFWSLSDLFRESSKISPHETLLFLFQIPTHLGTWGFCFWVYWFCNYNFLLSSFVILIQMSFCLGTFALQTQFRSRENTRGGVLVVLQHLEWKLKV